MNSNNLKDISKIYLEQVSLQLDEKKKEKPKFWWNDDGDNIGYEKGEVSGKFKRKRKSVKEALIGRQSEIDANRNDKIDAQDFKILRSTKKKKSVKEGFSNWREDLIEVADKIPSKDKDQKIVEKQVDNKIDINPKLDLGERVEKLGGTLLEMNEIEEFDQIFDDLTESEIFLLSDSLIEEVVEEFFYECIEEGYDLQEIENTLLESIELSNALLTEAEVTYGHDTDIKKDRLEKVKSAVKKVGRGLVRGAGYAAGLAVRGAKAVGRELGKGYQRGRYGASGGSGSSQTTSSRETQTTSGDGGESEDKKPGLLSRIGAKLKRGLVKVARSVSRGARNVARRLDDKGKKVEAPKAEPKKAEKPTPKPQAKTTSSSSSVNLDNPQGSATYRGTGYEQGSVSLKGPQKTSSQTKPQAKTTTVSSKPLSKEQRNAVKRAQRRNQNLSAEDARRIASSVSSKEEKGRELQARMAAAAAKRGISEDYYDLASKTVKSGKPGKKQKSTIETLAKTATTKKKTRTPVGTARRGSSTFKPSSPEEAESNMKSWDDYWSSAAKGYKEQYEIFEKAESEQQQKIFGLALSVKRGDTPRSEVSDRVLKIVDNMSEKEIRKFAKTKHEGLPHKVETKEEVIRQELIARMIGKIEEQSEVYVDEAKLPSSMKKGKKKVESKTQVIHDVDDNLADQRHPDAAKIDVMRKKSGKWEKVQSLTPSQFAHHKLRKPGEPVKEENDPGDKYGFDQFRSTEKFKKTTKANKPVVRLGDSPRRPAKKSVVTARGGSEFGSKKPSTPMDKPGEFAKDLKNRIGVKNLERKNVHFTGGMRSGSGPEKKGEVVKKIVKPDAKKVIATDDHLQNVRHMAASASSAAPKAKVRAYQSKPATKEKGKVKIGDIVPVRVGKEKDLADKNIGIRSNTSPSKSPKETQRRKKQQKMREEFDI